MSKKEQLLKSLGGNMNESIGIRQAVPAESALKDLVKKHDKYAGRTRSRAAGEMEIERIIPDPEQPRKEFGKEELKRMADNIRKVGILQPIRVRWSDMHDKWMIISGERRYRASKLAGLESIPCIFVEDEMEESDLRAEQLVENCQREDLLPIEQAKAFKALIDLTNWTAQRLASELNLSKATVVRSLAMLKLPTDIHDKVENGALSASAAYAISQVEGEARQRKLATQVIEKNLSRDETVELIKGKRPAEKKHKPVQKSIRRFTTKEANVIVEHTKANPSEADIQEALLAVVKSLGKQSVDASANRVVGSKSASGKQSQS